MNNKYNKVKSIEIKKAVNIFISVLACMVLVLYISGCSIVNLINESFTGKEETLELPEVDIDESEIKEIGKGEKDIRKSFDIENEVSIVDESVRDPFKPFYVKDEEEEEERNILELKKIFSKDGIEYVEISFNDYIYKLKEGDTLSDNYLVQAINVNSVVLLKGDEIITLFMNTPYYD